MFGIVNGGGQQRIKPQFAHALGQIGKARNRCGDGYCLGAMKRHSIQPAGAQICGIGRRRRPARCVMGQHRVLARLVVENKTVAADTRHLWFGNAQQHSAGNGCIHGIAATLQNVDGGLGGQRVRCGAHAVGGHHGRSARAVKIAHWYPLVSLFLVPKF